MSNDWVKAWERIDEAEFKAGYYRRALEEISMLKYGIEIGGAYPKNALEAFAEARRIAERALRANAREEVNDEPF
jgi:hypothetical protein